MSIYDEEILKIKREFIESLRADLKTDLLNKNIDNNEIRKSVYLFIYKKILSSLKIEKKIKIGDLVWSIFFRSVDFTLLFGEAILESILELRSFEMQEISDDIDA